MKTEKIVCKCCKQTATKPKKEIDRQRRNGRTEFYCSISCGSKGHKRSKGNLSNLDSHNRLDEFSPFRETLRRCKKRKHHPCNLTLEYLRDLWEKQSGRCVYTNVKLLLPRVNVATEANYNHMASLDRIDSKLGYIKGNVQFVSVSVNWLKNQMDDKHVFEFFDIVTKVKGQNGSTGSVGKV